MIYVALIIAWWAVIMSVANHDEIALLISTIGAVIYTWILYRGIK